MEILRQLASASDGTTMVEYSVMISLIAAVCYMTISALGPQVNALFKSAGSGW